MKIGKHKWFTNGNLPTQTVPFPVNPSLQVQVKDPSLLKQLAFLSHGPPFFEHSSISEKDLHAMSIMQTAFKKTRSQNTNI